MIPSAVSAPPRQPPRLRAIFLDAKGTLFGLREPVGVTYSRIAGRHGLHADPGRLDAAFRTAWNALSPPLHPEDRPPRDDDRSWWRELVRRTFAGAARGAAPAQVSDAIFDEIYAHYAKATAWELHEETPGALGELSRRYRLLVLSNFDRRLPVILEGLGIAGFFERVIVSSEVGASKPHPRMFRAALASCGLPPEECLHVGDDPRADVEGARAAGIACYHVCRPGATLRTLVEKLASDDFPACMRGIPD